MDAGRVEQGGVSNVTDIGTRHPHLQGTARCLHCRHEWQVQAPIGTVQFECPQCCLGHGVLKHPFEPRGGTYWECGCGADLYYVLLDGVQCYACGTITGFAEIT